MLAFVCYEVDDNVQCYFEYSPAEMWAKLREVLTGGYTWSEIRIKDNDEIRTYTLYRDPLGAPFLVDFKNGNISRE